MYLQCPGECLPQANTKFVSGGDYLLVYSDPFSTVIATLTQRFGLMRHTGAHCTPIQLMFAGEVTHSNLFLTANAVYDTGITTAKTLNSLTNYKNENISITKLHYISLLFIKFH